VIIMISACADIHDVVQACQLNVDDFLLKSETSPDDLIERVGKAIMRRQVLYPRNENEVSSGPLEIDYSTRRVKLRGKVMRLTKTQYAILAALLSHPGKVLTHNDLYSIVYMEKPGDEQTARNGLKSHISTLRRKISDGGRYPVYINSVYGSGYRWSPDGKPESAYDTYDTEGEEYDENEDA
jgi:DNA-binding response OmpR family regulator